MSNKQCSDLLSMAASPSDAGTHSQYFLRTPSASSTGSVLDEHSS